MKLKYFLRGLGVGILFTSIIFFVAYQREVPVKLTDEAVIQRAKALGMVEKEDTLKNLLSAKEDSSGDNNPLSADEMLESSKDETKVEDGETTMKEQEEAVVEEDQEAASTEHELTTEINTSESVATENKTAEHTERETITVSVKGGDSSYTVSQSMQRAGLIEDAAEFDAYLIQNGYAKRIRVGTYELKKGMNFQELAEAISDTVAGRS